MIIEVILPKRVKAHIITKRVNNNLISEHKYSWLQGGQKIIQLACKPLLHKVKQWYIYTKVYFYFAYQQ